ncbi:hypothetical protein [Paenarthrobacter nicotinovorans]|uniref:hypothetical protein n=1 Tax=Paenarthrobacter nicotinovorans TaxID=29320 RepID=UPI000A4191D1|nr:hypothetical protein [Paenarthrobacter nicotinovorans]
MNNIQASGELLTASVDDRTLTYRLLPFGEAGSTNVGKVIASKGSITIPDDLNTLELNEEHNFQNQIGKFVRVEELDTHIEATVRIVNTSKGNDALVLAAEGLRTGISVEIANPVIRNGHLIAGNLTGAGLVVRPAFSNARLTASDMGESISEKETTMETTSNTPEATEVAPVVQAEPIFASNLPSNDLGVMTFNAYSAGNTASMNAALADLKTTNDGGKFYIKDQEVGELWTARQNERKLVNAVGVKPLTSLVQTGTKKNRTFAVANWAGNKVELPTATFSTSRESWNASAKAVAVDVAMELIEFGGEGVISEAYEEAIDSYVVQTEAELLTYLLANSTSVTGLTSAVAAIDKASETLGNIGANMSFIAVAPNVMAALRSITSANAPWWLASQGAVNLRDRSIDLGGVTLVSNPNLANGTILVGDSRAVDYRESKDFKFRALDLPRGGVDISFIKFKSQYVTDKGAILKITGVTGA